MDYLRQAYRLSLLSGIFVILIAWCAFGPSHALGVAGGLVFALINIQVTEGLIKSSLGNSKSSRIKKAALWFLKIPLLYGACAVLILSPLSSPVGFIVGFSIWFVMIFASALKGASV